VIPREGVESFVFGDDYQFLAPFTVIVIPREGVERRLEANL
jgi:hypothetical protein